MDAPLERRRAFIVAEEEAERPYPSLGVSQ
jgi:hypothetical protein